jgi:hypothetical protein
MGGLLMATAVKTRSELGASSLSKGKAWMYDLARWLRDQGFPGVDVISGNRRADLAGLTEWTIECKYVADDAKMPAALDQAVRDQAARGTAWHVVLRKRRQRGPAGGLAIMTIEQWARIAQILDRREEPNQ